MLDRLTAPGVGAHIDTDRAVICANSALHTTCRIRDDLSRREKRVAAWFPLEEPKNSHVD
jgi:hypothetical protein